MNLRSNKWYYYYTDGKFKQKISIKDANLAKGSLLSNFEMQKERFTMVVLKFALNSEWQPRFQNWIKN